jgi:hypothetical protein
VQILLQGLSTIGASHISPADGRGGAGCQIASG